MSNVIVILILLALVAWAVVYIVKAKKKGRCIGCPNSSGCGGSCHCKKE